jgi:hypothetical protein
MCYYFHHLLVPLSNGMGVYPENLKGEKRKKRMGGCVPLVIGI